MGTLLALTVPTTEQRHVAMTFDTARRWERALSRHDPASALRRLARPGSTSHAGGFVVSAELARALRIARTLAQRTDGAFDPGVGAALALWREATCAGRAPSARALRAATRHRAWDALEIRGARVELKRSGIELDLGGIGKGLALDRITCRLRRAGCTAAILNFGESSLVAIGHWRVYLRHPRGGFAGQFDLHDRACSTSGTYGHFLSIGRRRVSHVVDPRTGQPLRALAQVTVISRSAAVAEALSTACLVLGRQSVARIARRFRVEVCWIDRRGFITTPRFPLAVPVR
jgi:thiamine biosynthesis lipoprotein